MIGNLYIYTIDGVKKMNIDYKILSKVLSIRMTNALGNIIDRDQIYSIRQ